MELRRSIWALARRLSPGSSRSRIRLLSASNSKKEAMKETNHRNPVERRSSLLVKS